MYIIHGILINNYLILIKLIYLLLATIISHLTNHIFIFNVIYKYILTNMINNNLIYIIIV